MFSSTFLHIKKKPEAEPIKLFQVVLRPPLSPVSFYEGIFHWLTGTAEQGNPSLHGLVGMTDWCKYAAVKSRHWLHRHTDPVKENAESGQTEKTCSKSFATSIYFCDLTRSNCFLTLLWRPVTHGWSRKKSRISGHFRWAHKTFSGQVRKKDISLRSFVVYIVYFF